MLTPEQVERLVLLMGRPGETLFGENVPELAATLREYAAIVEEVSSTNPVYWTAAGETCVYCGGRNGHRDTCPYSRARKARGYET